MTHTMDNLFNGDDLLGDVNDLDNLVEHRNVGDYDDDRNSEDGNQERDGEADGEADEDEDNENKDKKGSGEEKKVKRVVKRPQPKLDPDRLRGPRGLQALPKAFADFKFKGKGREAEDLQCLMSRLEHWAHRLFPKLQFDDFLEKIEKLGSKKIVQVYIKRLRMGIEEEADCERLAEDEADVDDPNPANPIVEEAMGEFDRLLAEQVSHYTENPPTPFKPSTPSSIVTPIAKSTPAPGLTAEQKERIERNRREAMERRQARLAALANQPKENETEVMQVVRTVASDQENSAAQCAVEQGSVIDKDSEPTSFVLESQSTSQSTSKDSSEPIVAVPTREDELNLSDSDL